ncbi:MAG: alpha-mannosidase [Armatimonadota bacterium]
MITNRKILGKLEQIDQRYDALRFEKVANVPMQMCETLEHFRQAPLDDPNIKWESAEPGTKWGGNWISAWFAGDIELPAQYAGKKVFVRGNTGGETLFTVNGEYKGVFDENHPVVMMTGSGEAGKIYRLGFEAYSGHYHPGCMPPDQGVMPEPKSKTFGGIDIVLEREDVSAFVFDLRVLKSVMRVLDDNSLRKNNLVKELAKVYAVVDMIPAESGEASWRPKLAEARKIMKPLLEAKNGSTVPWIGLIGHSHMDTAWLWPLTETWRKCARTFSSILNLMDQYPEFTFIQSSPCQTDMIRKLYPSIFEGMQERAAQGRWEPNGGMWVEPDCNIPSGEALVRQVLVAQNFTRKWFDYTADTLWMPDVFGYSAALPQILRKSNIEFFCTTKISWNDTTRFPYDTFVWKGIDGSPVISHYNFIHCWPDPETLTQNWNWVQHKDVQDRRLCSYGFGDGGGGPMMEMIEVARRVEDLEGSPKANHTTVGKFMQGVRDELTDIPSWAGELYLEAHRGTLTSIGAIKRGNRKSEIALRDAELLSTYAAMKGMAYPQDELLEIWKELLTNQFHDILPGSSIAEVNDLAIATFKKCIDDANSITKRSVESITGASDAGDTGVLVINTLSWDRSGEIVLDGVPDGMQPADQGIKAQWIDDVKGDRKLVASGLNVPALGAVVMPLAKTESVACNSPFSIGCDTIETPYADLRFDEKGRIVSFIDKSSGRDIVMPDGAMNTFLLGEDVPESWDNWDIDPDQKMKMHPDWKLMSRKPVAEGPLQLRLRSEYTIGANSSMVQDMVFHADSARVDFETSLNWAEKHHLFKVEFEMNVLSDFARHEIQYGHAERPTHTNLLQDVARFEVCAHKWSDLSENGFGVALLNDCKYGIGVNGSTFRLTLIKSGTHPDPRGDAGNHFFTYSLLPHASGFSVESVVRPAYELNMPVLAFPADADTKGFDGILSVDAPNVIIESIKAAENGDGIIVRLYEAEKTGCKVNLKFNVPVEYIEETNLLEEKQQELDFENNSVELFIKPFEIKTIRCRIIPV